MNVHVVCSATRDPLRAGYILRYKAELLASRNGWRVADEPDDRADLNYFFPYIDLAQRFPGYRETKVAAYFTHKDTGSETKRRWWRAAAQACDVRVTTAPGNVPDLEQYGPTVKARPPLDPSRFEGHRTEGGPIGVSGFVYKDDRKGQDLVEQLRQEFDLEASGQGWGRSQLRTWDDMPDWYGSLSLFVCASRVEGVPMTVLEALAVGTPALIGEGVGIEPDLPHVEGIYRFKAGSYPSLLRAVRDALRRVSRVDPDVLISVAQQYTVDAWADDHLRAFEGLLYDAPLIVERGDGKRGVFIVAFGGPSRKVAHQLIPTIRRHMPDLEIAFCGTTPPDDCDHFIQQPEVDIGGRAAKTRIYELAPDWEYVLYLDADTELVAPVPFLFDALRDGWDFVICKNPAKYHTTRRMVRPDNKPECEETYSIMGTDDVVQLNGGVFSFHRNPQTAAFFRRWHDEWQRYGGRDQAALLRALWASPLRMYVLGNEWNTVDRYMDESESAGIVHHPMTARRWRGIIHGRTDTQEAWNKVHRWRPEEGTE